MDAVYFRTGGWFAIEAESGAESGAFTHEHEAWNWIAARRVVSTWLETAKRPSMARACAERVSA